MEVKTHSFSNPGSLLANGECCDYNITAGDESCAVPGCDNYFYYCLRSIDSTKGGCSGGRVSMVHYNDYPMDFSQPTVFGLPNPLPLPGLTREWNVRILDILTDHNLSPTWPLHACKLLHAQLAYYTKTTSVLVLFNGSSYTLRNAILLVPFLCNIPLLSRH